MHWLPPPDPGTSVSGGFDGSDSDDFTVIKLVTLDGLLFTPRYGPDRRPTIWNPAEWGGRIPRGEVDAAWAELTDVYDFSGARVYYDPPEWETQGEAWQAEYGDELFIPWQTYRTIQMHAALVRFVTDLSSVSLRHDGCPTTTAHIANARRLAKKVGREVYGLGKPGSTQKIDAAVASVLAHLAASDARAEGWGTRDTRVICFR